MGIHAPSMKSHPDPLFEFMQSLIADAGVSSTGDGFSLELRDDRTRSWRKRSTRKMIVSSPSSCPAVNPNMGLLWDFTTEEHRPTEASSMHGDLGEAVGEPSTNRPQELIIRPSILRKGSSSLTAQAIRWTNQEKNANDHHDRLFSPMRRPTPPNSSYLPSHSTTIIVSPSQDSPVNMPKRRQSLDRTEGFSSSNTNNQ